LLLRCTALPQHAALRDNLGHAAMLFGRCPACAENFRRLWCAFTCSPHQARGRHAASSSCCARRARRSRAAHSRACTRYTRRQAAFVNVTSVGFYPDTTPASQVAVADVARFDVAPSLGTAMCAPLLLHAALTRCCRVR
jgi:hypothetical protein